MIYEGKEIKLTVKDIREGVAIAFYSGQTALDPMYSIRESARPKIIKFLEKDKELRWDNSRRGYLVTEVHMIKCYKSFELGMFSFYQPVVTKGYDFEPLEIFAHPELAASTHPVPAIYVCCDAFLGLQATIIPKGKSIAEVVDRLSKIKEFMPCEREELRVDVMDILSNLKDVAHVVLHRNN